MTSIEWTDTTWNPTRGCRRVSDECTACYAESDAHRRNLMAAGLNRPPPYEGLVRLSLTGEPRWTGDGRFVAEKLAEPLSWRKPRRVFVDSMSDLFFEAFTFEEIAGVFGVMAATPRHTYQVLTKRPERARAFFAWLVEEGEELRAAVGEDPPSGSPLPAACAMLVGKAVRPEVLSEDALGVNGWRDAMKAPWPLPNVWMGVSCGIRAALPRLDVLRQIPAARRFVSFEPLLEDLGEDVDLRGIDWAIIGGESHSGRQRARPCDVGWVRALIAAARFCGAAPFVKQLGDHAVNASRSAIVDRHGVAAPSLSHEDAERLAPEYVGGRVVRPAPVRLRTVKGGEMSEWPADLRIREFPEVRRG